MLRERPGAGSVIAVVSPDRGDGRSTVAAGLSAAIAEETKATTLLLDLDFEHPGQAANFGTVSTPGLSDYLRGAAALRTIAGQGAVPLWVIPAGSRVGPPLVSSLFRNLTAGDLLDACRERFQWIVIDLPPLRQQPEAALAAAAADAYVVVARRQATTFSALERTARLLPPGRPAGLLMTPARGR